MVDIEEAKKRDVEYRINEKPLIKIDGELKPGSYCMFSVDEKSYPYILLGVDSRVDRIEEMINHEHLHYLIWKIGENSPFIDCIYYMHDWVWKLNQEQQALLRGLSSYGLGFPVEYSPDIKMNIKNGWMIEIENILN